MRVCVGVVVGVTPHRPSNLTRQFFMLQPTNPFSAAETTKGSLSFDRGDEDIYDPSFLLPFFAHHLQSGNGEGKSPF